MQGGDNVIGGATPGAGNVISGNGQDGVIIQGSGASGNLLAGNLIGTDAAGTTALANTGLAGILVYDANDNTIGGTATGAGNVVAGNTGNGIQLDPSDVTSPYSDDNLIQGNFIGVDATGDAPLGNGGDGIFAWYATGNTIGGTAVGAGNVVAANRYHGLEIDLSSQNLVVGNLVGLEADGDPAGNGAEGIRLGESGDNTIGGTTPTAANVVSGNGSNGIEIAGSDATGNWVAGNLIGTDTAGTAAIANGGDGVLFDVGAGANVLGGDAPGAGNIVAFNAGNGVTVGDSPTDAISGDVVLGNSIYANGKIGIDLGDDGPTPNGADGHAGPNLFQDFPVLTSAVTGSGSTTIGGTISGAINTTYHLEFFANPAGASQGQVFLGYLMVATDGSGNGSFTFTTSSPVAVGLNITATATDPGGNTSEFSTPVAVQPTIVNVTGELSVKFGGFVYNRTTRRFTQTLTITNVSGSAITGPIELVLLNLENATLVNQSGTYQGSPYITVLSAGSLGAGQSVSITLVFNDPTLATISYTPEFLAGPIPPDND